MSTSPLLARLGDDRASVRRLAAMDLAKLRPSNDELDAIVDHLNRVEPDEKTAVSLIRQLGRARHDGARPVLWRLYDDQGTSVRIAHAAILAHDHIEEALCGDVDGA